MKIPITLFTLFISLSLSAQWNPIQKFPGVSTDGAFSFVINGIGYVGGGFYSKRFYAYDPPKDSWTQLADVPSHGPALSRAFSFTVGTKGYVGGGSNPTSAAFTADFYEYDPATNKWTQLADFPPGPRDGCFSFVIGNKAYVGGGYDGTASFDDFYEYDVTSDTWTGLDDYPAGPVRHASGFAIENHGYVGGGGTEKDKKENSGIWRFDTTAGGWWTYETTLPGEGLQAAVAFVINGKAIWGGGMSNYEKSYSEFWVYDPETKEWSFFPTVFPNDRTAWSTSFVMGSKACVGLGSSLPGHIFSNEFFTYDFDAPNGSPSTTNPQEVQIYPNPANEKLNFNLPVEYQTTTMKIYNQSGRLIKTFTPALRNSHIDISGFQPGLYFIMVISDDQIISHSFIKS